MTAITINVDDDLAKTFAEASTEQRQKYERKFNLWFEAAVRRSKTPLQETMDRISQKAKARGMTPEILESILNDEE
ncbi:MAG: hypothetical protein FD138_2296 [Planctomycetota bacterium]|nr:MAG: hypothetical protein FD138_2296 [Planctomycetota bacterium]